MRTNSLDKVFHRKPDNESVRLFMTCMKTFICSVLFMKTAVFYCSLLLNKNRWVVEGGMRGKKDGRPMQLI